MKVVVLVKQVPLVTDLKFDPETKTLIREGSQTSSIRTIAMRLSKA